MNAAHRPADLPAMIPARELAAGDRVWVMGTRVEILSVARRWSHYGRHGITVQVRADQPGRHPRPRIRLMAFYADERLEQVR